MQTIQDCPAKIKYETKISPLFWTMLHIVNSKKQLQQANWVDQRYNKQWLFTRHPWMFKQFPYKPQDAKKTFRIHSLLSWHSRLQDTRFASSSMFPFLYYLLCPCVCFKKKIFYYKHQAGFRPWVLFMVTISGPIFWIYSVNACLAF